MSDAEDAREKACKKREQEIFNYCFRPVIAVIIIFSLQLIGLVVFSYLILNDSPNHLYEVKNVVLRYPDRFTPSEVNATRYDFAFLSPVQIHTIGQKSVGVLTKIALELSISLAVIGILGFMRASKAKQLVKLYENPESVRSKDWLDSGSTLSTSISAAVSVVVALVGAVSLLSPGVAGGFLIGGLEILLICIIVGILIQDVRTGVVKEIDSNTGKVIVNPEYASAWQGLTIMQFLFLIVGISLLVVQIVLFL